MRYDCTCRSRSWDWNCVWIIDQFSGSKPVTYKTIIWICNFRIRINRSNCIVRINDGILNSLCFLILSFLVSRVEREKRDCQRSLERHASPKIFDGTIGSIPSSPPVCFSSLQKRRRKEGLETEFPEAGLREKSR